MAMNKKLINVGNGKKRYAKCLIKIIDEFLKIFILVFFTLFFFFKLNFHIKQKKLIYWFISLWEYHS